MSIARQCLIDAQCRKHIVSGIGQIVQREVKMMCSSAFNSVLTHGRFEVIQVEPSHLGDEEVCTHSAAHFAYMHQI